MLRVVWGRLGRMECFLVLSVVGMAPGVVVGSLPYLPYLVVGSGGGGGDQKVQVVAVWHLVVGMAGQVVVGQDITVVLHTAGCCCKKVR